MQRFPATAVCLISLLLAPAASQVQADQLRVLNTSLSAGVLRASNSTDLTQTVSRQDVFPSQFGLSTIKARASVASLGVSLEGRSSSAFAENSTGTAQMRANVIFSSAPGITSANIGWSARVRGVVDGNVIDSSGEPAWTLLAFLQGSGLATSLNVSETFQSGSAPVVVDTTITALGQVPTNTPIEFIAEISLRAVLLRNGDSLRVNFFDSVSFNPSAFFDIQTPGVTVNGVNPGWLVNNQIVVPEPSSLTLAALSAVAMACGVLRRRIF